MTSDHYAALAWLKAENLLREALVQRPEEAPGAAIHLAYYAMFHAARAVLILLTGTSPKRHSTLITQFGFHVKDRSSELRRASDNLNKLQARRIRADYSDTIEISASDAVASLERSYTDNELRVKRLLEELVTEREAIVQNAERVRQAIRRRCAR